MFKAKKTLNISYWLITGVLLSIAAFTAFSIIPTPWKYRIFVVQSASMEPAIRTGSIVIVLPQEDYQKGNIITFLNSPTADLRKARATTTHRIIKINDDEGRPTYTTKGDASEDPDLKMIPKHLVLGRVFYSIPYIGYVVAFTKTQIGIITLIVIPGTVIVYNELTAIKKEIKKIFKKRNKKTKKDETAG